MGSPEPPRPRYSEREGRLLLAALHVYRKREGRDKELDALYAKLQRMYGDG